MPAPASPMARTLLWFGVSGVLALSLLVPLAASGAPAAAVGVIVRYEASATAATETVRDLGGTVTRRLGIINALQVRLPASELARLRGSQGIAAVTRDARVSLFGDADDRDDDEDPRWKADRDLGSLYSVSKSAGVHAAWDRSDARGHSITGRGIGVALIDSGVAPVAGLDDGRVVNGPDLSFESQADNLRHLDTFGHGTHMAGIISGRDAKVKDGQEDNPRHFVGVAPDSTLLSVKVASSDGATDVSQVIAALDWVVQHRDDDNLNIRVINLSFGTQSTQSYVLDPLAYAVEVAWRKGIVVVVSAGNDGNGTDTLSNPAVDPYVIAVGAADHQGTQRRTDDTVATFSSRGSAARAPDLVAPGRSIVSLRDPGSSIDQEHPSAIVTMPGDDNGARLFRGSGTSQSAAFVSGVAALLLQQRPELSPDDVKRLLTSTADPITGTDPRLEGAGLLDVRAAIKAATPTTAPQDWERANGTGSLEAARGGSHVTDPENGTELVGEQDIFGQAWDGRSWAEASWAGRSWAGGDWNGRSWAGRSWAGYGWARGSWPASP